LFLAVILGRLALLPLLPVPIPGIHDEYSYLLMGDTFVHARLANPTHPMWLSFETFHVNWQPTYSSIYPPAQGAILAVGQLLGRPWFGVLLSVAAMCAAIAWMLQAWMPAHWALLGGVLAALARIARRPNIRNGLILGFGVAILANSRPYEGLLFCIPVAVWFLWWLAGKTKPRIPSTATRSKVLAVVFTVLICTGAFMAYYNWRLTGNALLMPQSLRTRTYHSAGLFLWDHPRPPLHYNNQQFEDFYDGWEHENYRNTWADARRVSLEKITRGASTFLWWGAVLLTPGFVFACGEKKCACYWLPRQSAP
jgi:hypothetical protein